MRVIKRTVNFRWSYEKIFADVFQYEQSLYAGYNINNYQQRYIVQL